MRFFSHKQISRRQRLWHRHGRRLGWGIVLALLLGISLRAGQLYSARDAAVDGILVLGGSIRREMYVAQQPRPANSPPILISQGSADPCIWLLFQQSGTPMDSVWLEKCAQSTWANFVYSLPVLQRWGAHHIQLVTSASHLPRAAWLGRVMLGSHGIWMEVVTVPETGVPGNREAPWKTGLDLLRGLGWAVVSQVYSPRCGAVMPLAQVDMAVWQQRGFKCEHQAGLDAPRP